MSKTFMHAIRVVVKAEARVGVVLMESVRRGCDILGTANTARKWQVDSLFSHTSHEDGHPSNYTTNR